MQLNKFLPKYQLKRIEALYIVASLAYIVSILIYLRLLVREQPKKKAKINPLLMTCVDDN